MLATIRRAWEASDPKRTQRELAAESGVSQSQVSKMLAGKKGGTFTEVDALCTALGLDVVEVARAAKMAAAEKAPTLEEHVIRHLSPEAQAGVREGQRIIAAREAAKRASQAQPNGQ